MSFKDSKTYENLQTAFAGESKAYTKYSFYSKKAREDGFEQIANIFKETAGNELEHAEIWFRWLNETDELPYTLDNLVDAKNGENYEWSTMYKNFAKTARQEGYCALAKLFERIGKIEHNHDERYSKLIENMETATVFCKDTKQTWICQVCGHETYGECSPEVCPVCGHEQAFTELKATNY